MKLARAVRGAVALSLVLGLVPLGTAQAARNKPPRIKKAEMKDKDGDGLGDRIVLTYNERINHKLDTRRFPFRVDGYKILKVNGARKSLKLTIVLKESDTAPVKPAFVKYSRTKKQPVRDLKKKQAAKQLLNRNIIGLAATPPPPPEEGEFSLSVAKSGDGLGTVSDNQSKINCGTSCGASYPEGTSVTLTASPDAATQAKFAGWTGACTGTTTTCTVTMDADKSVTAGFSKAGTFLLTVSKGGTGTGTVTSTSAPTQPAQINCGTTCSASYPKDAKVTLTATADQANQSNFAGFSGGGCGLSSTCEVTMTQAQNVTATFNKIGNFLLTITKAGSGTGLVTSTSSPAQTDQINCGSKCTASYPAATQVTLTATPDQGMTFAGWSNGGCTGTTPTCQVTVNAANGVTATFNSPTTWQLTVEKSGSGTGSVAATSNPSQATQVNCGPTCQVNYPNNATVTLTATADIDSDFFGWSGGGCSGSELTCNVLMSENKTVTATFTPKLVGTTRTLTFSATNGTGLCSPPPEDGDGICNGTYGNGAIVSIVAEAAEGMDPLSAVWTGCDVTPLPLAPCVVTMTGDKTVTVTFSEGSLLELSVSGGRSIQ
ncbi:MAG TPA: hypothetical protein VJ927_02875 [Actinomycetota bacterium]|nr:hypothetical protein [Actinomycetota bacterium]